MLLVNARKGPSALHGFGLIAREFVPRGTAVWRFRPGLDVVLAEDEYKALPPPVRETVYHYAYFHEPTREWVLSADDDRFANHADDPLLRVAGDYMIAVRDIRPGDEITQNYTDLTWLSPRPLAGPCRAFVGPCPLGRGLFAAADLRPGDPILRFDGPVIPLAEAIAKGDDESNPLQVGPTSYIDLLAPGVFGNHSCDPNAGIVDDRVLVALRDIRFGDEVRYDYSTSMWEDMWTMPCRCESATCRGRVTDFPLLPPAVREHYLTAGVVQRFIVERLEREGHR